MPSNLYKADKFFELQKKGKIAKGYNVDRKLNKDSKGFYLNKNTSSGDIFKQRVGKEDLVYSRAEGVTKYSGQRDKNKTKVSTERATPKEHQKHAHFGDRKSLTGKRIYKI